MLDERHDQAEDVGTARATAPLKKSDSLTSTEVATNRPVVSVVIPTCDRATLVRRAIESVRDQTFGALEIIVVDDASSDNTDEVVQSIADPRIRYLRHTHSKGGSAARNTGIRAATGRYIAFLDDDDEWERHKTEEHLKALQNYDVVLCTLDGGGEDKRYAAKVRIELEDLRRGQYPAGGTGALMGRAEVIKAIMFDESLPRYQDWDLFIRIAQKHAIGYLHKPLVRYNAGPHPRLTNRIANMPPCELEQQVCMLHKHKDFFGPRWFKRHMCAALLYGTRHRTNKVEHVRYVARRYGYVPAGQALWRRLRQKVWQ